MVALSPFHFPLLYGCLTGGALVTSLILTLRWNFDDAVRTHCKQPEFWPSISASTGDFMPQRPLWRIAVALAMVPRCFCSLAMAHLLLRSEEGATCCLQPVLGALSAISDVVRILSACGWTYLASFEGLSHHQTFFGIYIVSSFAMQLMQTLSLHWQITTRAARHRFSVRLKAVLLTAQLLAALGVTYFFLVSHVKECQPHGYSKAMLCEWLFALLSISFDASQYYELRELGLSTSSPSKAISRTSAGPPLLGLH
jgi:hypothetical protein